MTSDYEMTWVLCLRHESAWKPEEPDNWKKDREKQIHGSAEHYLLHEPVWKEAH
jgi:hypothetical protein